MSKLKYKFIIGIIITISLTFIINILSNISYADKSTDLYDVIDKDRFKYKESTINDLIKELGTKSGRKGFKDATYEQLIGGVVKPGGASYDTRWAYCIDPHEPVQGKKLGSESDGYTVTNIIDVKGIDDFKMVELLKDCDNAKVWDVTGKNRKYLYTYAVLAGLSQRNWGKFDPDKETVGKNNTDVYKAYMAYYTWAYGNTMHNKVHLSLRLVPKKGFSKNGYLNKKPGVERAEKIVDDFMKRRFEKAEASAEVKSSIYTRYEAYTVQTTDAQGNVMSTVNYRPTSDTWTFIGPYKIRYKKYEINSWKDDCTASEWGWTYNKLEQNGSNTSSATIHKDWKDLGSNKEFYIVIKGNYEGTVNVKLRSNEMIFYRAKIMLLVGGENRQNFSIYVTNGIDEDDLKVSEEIDLSGEAKGTPPGDLKIYKYRNGSDDNAAALDAIGFKIKNTEKGYVIEDENGNKTYEQNAEKATEYFTNGDGRLEILDLEAGNYEIYETQNGHYGYDVQTNGQISTTVINSDEETETLIGNPQKKTKISGYVWNDGIEGKNSSRNSLRDIVGTNPDGTPIYETPIEGIRVALWNIVDESFREIKTDSEGKYCFDDVLVDDVINNRLYVDFYYDGVEYAPVKHNINLDNGSKAVESTGRRKDINRVFGVISNDENNANHIKTNQNIGGFGEGHVNDNLNDYKFSLGYNTGEYSSLIDTNSKVYKDAVNDPWLRTYARAGETSNDASVKELNTGYSLSKVYNDIAKTTVDSVMIENVNLGLYRREQPNISVKKDIDSAQLEINGYGHVYDYNGKDKDSEYQNQYKENLGVKFGKEWTPGEYQLPIYKSDYTYTTEDKSKELKAYITYKIELSNNSVGIDSKVNTLFDYYDKTYMEDSTTKISIGDNKDDLETNGRIKNKFNYKDKDYNDQYKKLEIDTSGITIEAGKTKTIYVQFEFSRKQIYDIITSTDKDKNVLYNVAEVGSYASYYPADPKLDNDKQYKGQLYAGIDRSSSPGNATPGETKTYENDTDISPALKLEQKAEERSIEGKVFLDDIVKPEGYTGNTSDLMTGYERLGNGEYDDETEKGIDGVRVMLKSKTDDTRVYYIGESKQSDKENDKDIYTSNGGDFEISGFIPDEYELVYTWGGQQVNGETISVENYKGTIYKDEDRYNSNIADSLWYKKDIDDRRSDAVDDMEKRETIDGYYRTVTWNLEDEINDIGSNRYTMDSTTPMINMRIENTDENKDGKVNSYKTTSSGIEVSNAKYEIQNIDFGIVERAKQKVELTKRVKHLKLTLSNRQIISEAEFSYDDNGNLKADGEKKHMTFMGTTDKTKKGSTTNNCFIKIELDNELIQGSTLEVEYELLFENNSEKDYWSEDKEYYKFGVKDNSEIIKIKPSRIVDYLDKDWGFESNKNTSWKVFTSKYDDIVRDSELLSLDTKDPFKDQNSYGNLTSGRVVIKNEAYKDDEVEPTQVKRMAMEVSKKLTITDEIELENDTEIVKMEIPHGGRPLTVTRTPGQYYPGNSLTELSDKAEKIIVTPSTGKDLNFVVPITIGVIALITLGAGIILIKKKVVDNK